MNGFNGDDLGAMGETKFADLCARAGLIFNRASERDRAGWDFVINLDVDQSADTPLDKRWGRPTCVVQVKATSKETGSVRMTLSMAERLAKDANPCFICILRADADSEFVDAYLLHITGQRLAAILRRLRQESKKAIDMEPIAPAGREPDWQTAARKARLNKQYIVFTPRKDERIDVSGPALRAALMVACGNDAALYGSQKEKQRRELGYSEAPLQVVAKFRPAKLSELQDLFLGLREGVEVAEMNGTETRFDISLPQFSHLGGRISIQPAPFDVCRMTFRAPSLVPVSFDGQVFGLPPQLSGDSRRMRIKGPYAEINISQINSHVSITMLALWPKDAVSIEGWWTHFAVWQVMHLRGDIDLEPTKSGPIRFSLRERDFEPPPSVVNELELCDQLANALKHAGIDREQKFQWIDVLRSHIGIKHLANFIAGTAEPIVQTVPRSHVRIADDQRDNVFIGTLSIGEVQIGYYVVAKVSLRYIDGNAIEIRIDEWRLSDVRRLTGKNGAESYRQYVEQKERTTVGMLTL